MPTLGELTPNRLRNPGNRGKGRPKGVPNKVTRAFREAVLTVFEDLGGTTHLQSWAIDNPTEFYRICGRLIPHEVVGEGGEGPVLTKVIHEYITGPKP